MDIELRCPCCCCQFNAPADTPYDRVLDQMFDDGPWYALAEGETFADMIRAAVADRGQILCPDCHSAVSIKGLNLPRRIREMMLCG